LIRISRKNLNELSKMDLLYLKHIPNKL
jgi:hypothetical protein